MAAYTRETIGNIVIIRNIIFKNTHINKDEVDHAWQNGRPCIIIYSDEEYDYFLAIKSSSTEGRNPEQYIPIAEEDLLYKNKSTSKQIQLKTIKGNINLENIYKMPIHGHNEIGKVTFSAYRNIINRLIEYYKKEDLGTVFKNAKIIHGGR